MKKLLLISLIIGTALSQTEHERNRIARLRRRQQLENLSERDFSNGGFLPSGSSRVSDGFRGSENSFDTLSGRRRRFQSNVVMQNVDSPVSRPRNYLQSLRSTFRRNGGRTGRLRGSFWNTNRRPVDEQTVRRTYRPAIKRPRFTPNIRDILPRRRPSYSPTARGIDSVWTPRLPSTVTEAGNFHPSNINDFIERTNPVNDRSYISPKKPSLIVEPIPLPPLIDPGHISAKEQNPSQTHKPDYVAPVDSVLPVKEISDYVTPVDPVLPVKEKSDYVAPVDPVLPINHKPDYVAPADLDASLMPNLPEPEMLPLPSLPKIPFDVIDPLTIPPVSVKNPNYVPKSADPSGSVTVKDQNYVVDAALKDPLGPLDSSSPLDIHAPGYVDPGLSDPLGPIPNVKDANYVADKALKDPLGPLDSSSLPLDINAPGYVDPVLSDPLGPLPNVKDANYVADKALTDPLGPLDSSSFPLDINAPGYVDPSLSDPLGPLPNVKNANYVADKALTDPLGPLDSSSLPLDINAPGYVDPGLSDPLGPKTNVKDANYVADKALKDLLGPLDSSSLPLDMNDPGYVDPALSDPLPNVNDPNYVADPLTFDPSSTLDIPTLPVKETNNIGLEQLGPLDRFAPSDISGMPVPEFPNFPVDVNDPNYVEPPATGLVGPLDQLPFGPSGAAGLGLDPLPIDQMNPLRPLTPLGTWDSSAILPSTKPGYVPPNESPVGSMGPIGDVLSDPHIPDTLPISTDALLEPLLPTGGLMGEHLLPLESSKNRNPDYDPTADPQALVINNQANVLETSVDIPGAQVDGMPIPPKNKVPKGSIPDVFGPLDLPQDAISSQDPFSQFPTDNMSPLDGGLLFPSDIPSLPGLFDPLSTDFGSNGGPIDLFPDPSNFAPEPPLPHSPIFDENLPPNLDTNAFPLDPPMPTQVMTRSEINEAARREYAKSADAFDPKWNNPNVRNSDLYVKAKPVDPNAARPANVKTLFDFTAGTASADFINKAVDKVSEKTKDIMTARSRKREGYLTKYDALRSYEG